MTPLVFLEPTAYLWRSKNRSPSTSSSLVAWHLTAVPAACLLGIGPRLGVSYTSSLISETEVSNPVLIFSCMVEIHFGLWHYWILYLWRPMPGGTITSCWQYKLDWLGADNIVRNDIQFSSWHYCLLNLCMTNCLLSLPSDTWAPTQVTGNAIMQTVDQSLAVPGRSLSPSSPSDRRALGEMMEGRKFIFPPLVPKGISRLPDPQQRSHPRA